MILAEARAIRAGLIVVGSRGLVNIASSLLGSTAREVMVRSDRPVLVVKGGRSPLRRILIVRDTSAYGRMPSVLKRQVLRVSHDIKISTIPQQDARSVLHRTLRTRV